MLSTQRAAVLTRRFDARQVPGLKLWLKANRSDITANFAARSATVSGTSGTKALTLSGADALLEAGMTIRAAGTDVYTIATVVGTAIATVETLTANYSGSALALRCASQVNDLSGNGKNASQATASLQPAILPGKQNGRQVLKYPNADCYLTIASMVIPQPFTVFAVYNFGNVSTTLIDSSDGSSRVVLSAGSTGGVTDPGQAGMFASTILADTVDRRNTWLVEQAIFNGAASQLFVNSRTALAVGDAGANNMASLRIGDRFSTTAGSHLNGYLAEMLIYAGVTPSSSALRVQSYLKQDWGVSY